MSKLPCVFVIADKAEKFPDLLAGARTLGENVHAIVVGSEADAKAIAAYCAGTVFFLASREDTPFVEYAASMAAIIRQNGNAGLVMLPTGKNGKCLGAKLAARLGVALCNDIDAINVDGGRVVVRHMVYGGMAFGTERFIASPAVITLGGGVFESGASLADQGGGIMACEFILSARPMRRIEVLPRKGSSTDLGKARRVISVGRGLRAQEDLALIEQLGKAIGAEVGCTRPIAEAEHWLESERYIGVSGVMLKSDIFLSVGVSGQIQHMVGASACKTIISINKDKNAPVFKFADYGIVGDLYKIVPRLIEAFKA